MDIPMEPKTFGLLVAILFSLVSLLVKEPFRAYPEKGRVRREIPGSNR